MKTIVITILFILGSLCLKAQSQSGLLNAKEQSIGIGTGLDYSVLPLIISYDRGLKVLNYQYPVSLGLELTTPLFSPDLKDLRLKIKGATTLFQKGWAALRGGINPVLTRVHLKTQEITSIGLELEFFAGYISEKWNLGLEASYNKVLTSYIKHSQLFKENIFAEVQDGWYQNTAGNLRLGVHANYRIKRFDLYLKTGMSKTGKFNDYLFVPGIYTVLGTKFRF